jgi:hypothetical protein
MADSLAIGMIDRTAHAVAVPAKTRRKILNMDASDEHRVVCTATRSGQKTKLYSSTMELDCQLDLRGVISQLAGTIRSPRYIRYLPNLTHLKTRQLQKC